MTTPVDGSHLEKTIAHLEHDCSENLEGDCPG